MNSPRPFGLRMQATKAARDVFEIDVEVAPGVSDANRKELSQLIDSYATAFMHGAFDLASARPSNGVRISATTCDPALLRIGLDFANADLRALNVLLNCLHAQAAIDDSVCCVNLGYPTTFTHGMGALQELQSMLRQNRFPLVRYDRQLHAYRRDPGSYRQSRRALLEFSAPLGEAMAEECVARLNAWCRLTFGGFPSDWDSMESGDCLVIDAEASPFGDDGIEIVTDYFGASEEAWFALENLADRIHRDCQAVSSLVIW